MTHLSVNVNKIALLRNSRAGQVPSVTDAARTCLAAGAHGITVHPRPDQRHIRPADCDALKELIDTHNAPPTTARVEFNIEGNPFDHSITDHLLHILHRLKPDQATLVPDAPDQATSDHGWDLTDPDTLHDVKQVTRELQALGIRVSLFMDPDPDQIVRVPDTGADRIELYTEAFATAFAKDRETADQAFATYHTAAQTAHALGLGLNAGHDLNLQNLPRFLEIPHIAEVSIGHALIADALALGLHAATAAYLKPCLKAP